MAQQLTTWRYDELRGRFASSRLVVVLILAVRMMGGERARGTGWRPAARIVLASADPAVDPRKFQTDVYVPMAAVLGVINVVLVGGSAFGAAVLQASGVALQSGPPPVLPALCAFSALGVIAMFEVAYWCVMAWRLERPVAADNASRSAVDRAVPGTHALTPSFVVAGLAAVISTPWAMVHPDANDTAMVVVGSVSLVLLVFVFVATGRVARAFG